MSESRWYVEALDGECGLTIRIERMLYESQSPFQKIEIFENKTLGRVMALDGAIMLTERDEHCYHDMLVHPAMLASPHPKRVLVIGGGDGGTLREVLKHPEVEEAVLCEIDGEVIEASRQFLPTLAVNFDHPKAKLHVGDGVAYIRENQNAFDVILIDSGDPVGFAEGLFREPFYRDVKAALKKPGIIAQQTETPYLAMMNWGRTFGELRKVFSEVHVYAGNVPMYPGGYWTYAFASPDLDPWECFDPERVKKLGELKYYRAGLQQAAFVLPGILKGAEG